MGRQSWRGLPSSVYLVVWARILRIAGCLPEPAQSIQLRRWRDHIAWWARSKRSERIFRWHLFHCVQQIKKLINALSNAFNHQIAGGLYSISDQVESLEFRRCRHIGAL